MEQYRICAFSDEAGQDLDVQIRALTRNRLEGMEIRFADGVNIYDMDKEQVKSIRRRLDDAGLKVRSIGSPVGKINIETGDWAAHQERFKLLMEYSDILGAEDIRIFSFFIPQGKPAAPYKEEVIERLGILLSLAEGHPARLCHENEKDIYGDTAERCRDILDALPALGAIFDPANFVQCGVDTLAAWEMLKDRITYMHIKDAVEDGSVVPPGKGIGHLPEIVGDYTARGGRIFTLEPHLTVFDGLSAIEQASPSDKIGKKYVYNTSDEAFDAAAAALRSILETV